MAGYFTDFANNKILDAILGGAAFTPPGTVYIGLSSSAANKAGAISEPSSGNYSRVAVTNNLSSFPSAVGGSKSNGSVISFNAPLADWGSVQSVFVADALVGGNVWAIADLTNPKVILNGSAAPKLALGALYISHT